MALGLLAGCSGDDGDDGDSGDDGNGDDENGDGTSVDEWLSETENYDGVDDFTGEDEVTVQVGEVEGAPQTFVFEPAAIRIDTGTTVVWEWADTRNHSVTAEEGEFDSGVTDEGPFEYSFDEAGEFRYYCEPHRGQNQLGAVVVE